MKRSLSVLLICCLLAALLSGCAGEMPELPPLPGAESPSPAPEDGGGDVVVIEESAEAPEALELSFSLPTADPRGEELAFYFSPAEEFDCAFAYPSYCTAWVEKGVIRLNPSWFFARMFLSSVLREDENAPGELIGLLEVGKWGTQPEEGTAGVGHPALRASHLKYDTWRYWTAWETPERYYLLYGACFDHHGEEETLDSIFETIAESFRTGGELLTAAPESGTLLRQNGSLSLYFEGAALGGGSAPRVELRLRAVNGGEAARTLAVTAYTADGTSFPLEETLAVAGGEGQLWTLSLPLGTGEGPALFRSLGFWIDAQGDGQNSLFELPVRIELNG